MARCGCASDVCGCNFVAGDNVTLSGNGSRSNPYVVDVVVPDTGGGGTVDPGTGSGTRFAGEITIHAGLSSPAGWLLCNGAQVNRTTYSDLFAAIGVGFGAGNGNTTFNLPNFTDRIPFGAGPLHPRGTTNGTRDVALTTAHLPSHAHSINHDHGADTTATADVHYHDISHGHTASSSAVGDHGHALDYRAADTGSGGSGANVGWGLAGAAAISSAAAVKPAGGHAHSISVTPAGPGNSGPGGSHNHTFDVSPFNGQSGLAGSSSPTPVTVDPPNQAINYVIKY